MDGWLIMTLVKISRIKIWATSSQRRGKKLKENDKVTVYNDDGSVKIKYDSKIKIKIKDPDYFYLGDSIIELIEDKT